MLLLGLMVNTLLCSWVTTANAIPLQWTTVGISTLVGWAAILLFSLRIRPCHRAARHAESMLQGTRESFSGVLTYVSSPIQIPNSIAIQNVQLQCESNTLTLHVFVQKMKALPPDGTPVRVATVHRYIVAWEAQIAHA